MTLERTFVLSDIKRTETCSLVCLKAASKSYNESFSDDRSTMPNRHCALRLFLVIKTFDFSV